MVKMKLILEKSIQDRDEIMEKRTKAAILRSKAQWYCEGEKSTKYFLNLEKKRSAARNVTALLNEDGSLNTNPVKILDEQRKFYEQLYTPHKHAAFMYVNDGKYIKVSEEERESMEGLISLQEITTALKTSKRNRTPGSDGLPPEFYVMFWGELGPLLVEAANASYENGILFPSARQGLITCIPKKDKDSRVLKNVRPITLLNTDYKLIEKCLANRLKSVLMNLIHQDQKGFLPNRKIAANIWCILDIIDYINNEEQQNGLIISYDFEKCFDKI